MKWEGAHTFLQEHEIIGDVANGYHPLKLFYLLALDVKLSVSALSSKGPGQVHKSSPRQPPIWGVGGNFANCCLFIEPPSLLCGSYLLPPNASGNTPTVVKQSCDDTSSPKCTENRTHGSRSVVLGLRTITLKIVQTH